MIGWLINRTSGRTQAFLYDAHARLFPDRCEITTCSRKGIRGNENVIDDVDADGNLKSRVICDYCIAHYHRKGWRPQDGWPEKPAKASPWSVGEPTPRRSRLSIWRRWSAGRSRQTGDNSR